MNKSDSAGVGLWFAGEFGNKIDRFAVAAVLMSPFSNRRLGDVDDHADELVPGTTAAGGFGGA